MPYPGNIQAAMPWRYAGKYKAATLALRVTLYTLILLCFGWLGATQAFCGTPGYKQVGAFTSKINADKLLAELHAKGKAAFVLEKNIGNKTFFTVLESLPEKSEAEGASFAIDHIENIDNADDNKTALRPEAAAAEKTRYRHEKILVPMLDKRKTSIVTVFLDDMVYANPSKESKPIGAYGSLSATWYISELNGWHMIWIPSRGYGYIPSSNSNMDIK